MGLWHNHVYASDRKTSILQVLGYRKNIYLKNSSWEFRDRRKFIKSISSFSLLEIVCKRNEWIHGGPAIPIRQVVTGLQHLAATWWDLQQSLAIYMMLSTNKNCSAEFYFLLARCLFLLQKRAPRWSSCHKYHIQLFLSHVEGNHINTRHSKWFTNKPDNIRRPILFAAL